LPSKIDSELNAISSQACSAGGNHEPVVEKTEEYPNGTTKCIISCKKCKDHFEIEY